MTDFVGPASALNSVTARPSDGRQWGNVLSWFKNCSSPATQDGTEVDAAWLNQVTGFFRALIGANGMKADGVTPVVAIDQTDNMPLNAVAQMIQRGQLNYGVDTGTADALLVAPSTAFAEYRAGMRLLVAKNPGVGANATANPTINVSGLGAVTIVKHDASALSPADLPQGAVFEIEFDGTHARLTSMLAISDVPKLTTVSPTIYVAPPGTVGASDQNPGTAALPMATIAGAYTLAATYFVPGGAVTIQLTAPATTYVAASAPAGLATPVIIRGDPATQDNYDISGSGGTYGVFSHTSGNITYSGVRLANAANTTALLGVAYGAQVSLNNVTLAATGTGNTQAAVSAQAGGSVTMGAGIKVVSNFGSFITATAAGNVTVQQGGSVTFAGGPAFSAATVVASGSGSNVSLAGATLSGAASGIRYNSALNAVINTGGGGANFIPGTTAGSSATGGEYA